MKNIKCYNQRLLPIIPLFLLAGLFSFVTIDKPLKTDAYEGYSSSKLPTTIDLNDLDDDDIRDYYSELNSLESNERTKTNLLKNLKPILKNNQTYFSYDGSGGDAVWQAYEIVDRDWIKSPANKPETLSGIYHEDTNTITEYDYHESGTPYNDPTNPYVRALYVDRSYDNPMKAFSLVNGGLTGDNPKGFHAHAQAWGGFNQEHIWAKSHGFNAETDSNGGKGGARGDLMHLWPGDGRTNLLHSNLCFGFIDKSKTYTPVYEKKGGALLDYAQGNFTGTSLTLGSGKVFEPQDSDKGDIARALFYMAARYNNYAGETTGIDSNDPNLILSDDYVGDDDTGESTWDSPVNMGILSDLLEWNKLDPVDDYEIHRNNLLYNNFTNNRNPFIDFPEWADIIWGDTTGSADPSKDSINGKTETKVLQSIEITSLPLKTNYFVDEYLNKDGLVVKGHYDDGSSSVIRNYTCSQTTVFEKVGENEIVISYLGFEDSFNVNVINGLKYSFTIVADENLPGSYENANAKTYQVTAKEKTGAYPDETIEFKTSQIRRYSGALQFKKDESGCLYNLTDLGTISSVSYEIQEDKEDNLSVAFGSSVHPISGPQPSGGYFSIISTGSTGYLTSITVTYYRPILMSLTISGNYKTEFKYGDQFTTSGIKVDAIYNNGTSSEITSDVVFSTPNMEELGTQTITVSYGEIETTYQINVVDYDTSITATINPDAIFLYGNDLDKTDFVVSKVTASGVTTEIDGFTVSGYNKNQLGDQTITISYFGKSTTLNVSVQDYINMITVEGEYYDQYEQGSEFDPDGIEIIASYAGPTEDFILSLSEVTFSELDTSELGLQEIFVTFVDPVTGYTLMTSYTVEIVEPELPLLGCFGSVITSSSLITLLSLVGVSLLIAKKKEN